jgi:hypothetical protein
MWLIVKSDWSDREKKKLKTGSLLTLRTSLRTFHSHIREFRLVGNLLCLQIIMVTLHLLNFTIVTWYHRTLVGASQWVSLASGISVTTASSSGTDVTRNRVLSSLIIICRHNRLLTRRNSLIWLWKVLRLALSVNNGPIFCFFFSSFESDTTSFDSYSFTLPQPVDRQNLAIGFIDKGTITP